MTRALWWNSLRDIADTGKGIERIRVWWEGGEKMKHLKEGRKSGRLNKKERKKK